MLISRLATLVNLSTTRARCREKKRRRTELKRKTGDRPKPWKACRTREKVAWRRDIKHEGNKCKEIAEEAKLCSNITELEARVGKKSRGRDEAW